MNEIFDKLLMRVLFTLFICFSLFLYKYAHSIFYPVLKNQVTGRFYPSQNKVDTLHFFGRLLGIAIIYSTLEFSEYIGLSISIFHFFVWSTLGITLYLLSLWVMNSIVFYNFEYKDEVLKKSNWTYGCINFLLSICVAIIVRTLFIESERSLVILIILWIFSLVTFGILTKLYKYISKLPFNALMIQKDESLIYSFGGFIAGLTVLFISSFGHEHDDIIKFLFQIVLKLILASLILPIFKYGLNYIFSIDTKEKVNLEKKSGYAIYEGASFFVAALLTSMIISGLHFGTIYPFF